MGIDLAGMRLLTNVVTADESAGDVDKIGGVTGYRCLRGNGQEKLMWWEFVQIHSEPRTAW